MDAREFAIAMVEREQAEWEAAEAAIASGLARRTRRVPDGSSVVFTLRLDRGELQALESRGPADLVANDAVARLIAVAGEIRDMIT